MDLVTFWFALIGVLWTGYLVLEGFDFGVGALLGGLGRGSDAAETEQRRRVMLTTIGPHWDGNEVWLLTAGGATFAAFPHWYATMFSAYYLPLLALLVALIVRNMGLEYRHKRNDEQWRRAWDRAIIGGSVLAPLLVGTALTGIVRGIPLAERDGAVEFNGSLLDLLSPVALLGGVVLLGLSLTHGAHFIALKSEGQIRSDARDLAGRLGTVTAVLAGALLTWLGLTAESNALSWVLSGAAAVALLAAIGANHVDAEGWAFTATALTIALVVATYFVILAPNAMNGTADVALSLESAASSPMTLRIMTWAAVIFTPVVLAYTAWSYWTFRRRISTRHLPEPVGIDPVSAR